MTRIKKLLMLAIVLFITACGPKGQTIFYWEKEGVGPTWFAYEHNECLASADFWPWRAPAWPLGTNRLPELRFDNTADNGIWANFVPYTGAQPVYVNSLVNDATMSPSSYKKCMLKKGYRERQPSIIKKQLVPDIPL